jgi:hypothetical protein
VANWASDSNCIKAVTADAAHAQGFSAGSCSESTAKFTSKLELGSELAEHTLNYCCHQAWQEAAAAAEMPD